jgi:paraquat-inducible protein B
VSKKANPTIIGGFVLGAIAFVVVAVAVFGSGKFFSRHPRAVAFFQGNIQGLTVGSTVTLRGVEVGSVKAIHLNLDVKTMEPIIPVYMEFDPDRLRIPRGVFTEAELLKQDPLKLAIAKGLHARLATQSLVTGQLIVDLDLDPNEPRRFTGADPSTVEIPTTESDIDKLKKALTQLPLDQIATSALQLLQDADRLVKSDEIPKLLTLACLGKRQPQRLGRRHARRSTKTHRRPSRAHAFDRRNPGGGEDDVDDGKSAPDG